MTIESDTTYPATPRPKVILHLGPHKTGTTSFQAALARAEKELSRSDITVIGVQSSFSKQYRNWRRKYANNLHSFLLGTSTRQATIEALSARFEELHNLIPERRSITIISDENLIGIPPGHFIAQSRKRAREFYRAAPLVIEAARRTFADCDLQVVLVRRNLRDFLCSTYRDFAQKMQKREYLNEFVDNLSRGFSDQYDEFFTWAGLPESISVKVYDFSHFIQNTGDVVSELTGKLFTAEDYQQRNQSLSWRATEVAINLAPFVDSPADKKRFSDFLLNNIDGESPVLKQQANDLEKRIENRARYSVKRWIQGITRTLSGK